MKRPFTVSCSTQFKNDINALAEKNGVNVGDLARSILLTLPARTIAGYPDPGLPAADDREQVVLKSGAAKGRPWRRKPRLQVRLPGDHDARTIRKALALALALDRGSHSLALEDGTEKPPDPRLTARIDGLREEVDRLRAVVSVLSFTPLEDGVITRQDARHVMGIAPSAPLTTAQLRRRFRLLATIYHPDSPYGDHARMSQLNQAVAHLLGRT